MQILIHTAERNEGLFCFRATVGNCTAFVSFGAHGVQVLKENAAHKAWRGSGRVFNDIGTARDAYKSSEMRAIISAAGESFLLTS